MELIFFLVCWGASVVGAVCGIGGGVIIKPVLDAVGVLDVSSVSFLSGCTVLAMTAYSVIRSKMGGESLIEGRIGLLLALGAAAGGLAGRWLFSFIREMSPDKNRVGAVQAGCLLVVTIGTLLYTLLRKRVRTRHLTGSLPCMLSGLFLGILSSFLGIGGGPLNLVILFYFFSMTTKAAAENSLYIIFFSQLASLLSSIFTRNIPHFPAALLVFMTAGGITGGICGRAWNRRLKEPTVDRIFIGLMAVMILMNIYNIYKFLNG